MYLYKGPDFVPGVPARDLTNAEAKDYGVEDSPVYVKDGLNAVEAVGAAMELDAVSEDESEQQELENEIFEGVDNGNGS